MGYQFLKRGILGFPFFLPLVIGVAMYRGVVLRVLVGSTRQFSSPARKIGGPVRRGFVYLREQLFDICLNGVV